MATLRRSARQRSAAQSAAQSAESAESAVEESALDSVLPSVPVTKQPPSRKRKSVAAPAPSHSSTSPQLLQTKKPRGPTSSGTAEAPATPSKPRHAALSRLANPEATNAQLLSPETLRVVSAHPPDAETAVTPFAERLLQSKGKQRLTTGNILDMACAHLISVDPRMKPLIDAHYCDLFSPEGLAKKIDPFESLASSIISQQVSGAAAKSIKKRFVALFFPDEENEGEDEKDKDKNKEEESDKRFPYPSQVVPVPLETLRTAGLSQRKAEYVHGLAEKFLSGELTTQLLADAPYDELVERLVAVRGLGRWTAEMFAMFGLKRMDVFSVGDLGVQRGMAAFVGRNVAKLKSSGGKGKWKYMTDKEMEAISEPFRPYRSVFMWYMWRVEMGTDVSTLE